MHPTVGAVLAGVMIGLLYVLLGRVPNSGLILGLLVIGVGVGLVVARWRRLGPCQGELGSPWFESDLCEMLRHEVARSARFDRELTVAVVRERDGNNINWTESIRAADKVVACRNGWHVLVLPETGKDGAEALIERVTLESGATVQAVVMDPSVVHSRPDDIGEGLVQLVREAPEPSDRPFVVRRDTDRLRWPA